LKPLLFHLLTLNNFKLHRSTQIDLGASPITLITGANGSGKTQVLEAIILSLLGGLGGIIAGIVISYLIAITKHWHFTLFYMPPIVGFCSSVLTGIFFGFYPAYKASRLDPIKILRGE